MAIQDDNNATSNVEAKHLREATQGAALQLPNA
jgi:hypothetical protein